MSNFRIFLIGFSITTFLMGVLFLFLEKTPTFYTPTPNVKKFFYINLSHLFFQNDTNSLYTQAKPLRGVTLKGLYFDGKKGFVILHDKKTFFLDLGKSYNGYKLIKIGNNFAIFQKNNNQYKLTIQKTKNISNNIEINEDITISKETFKKYKNNLSKIWQNIGIIKTNEGYKIVYVKPKSIFEKIGLKKGDILLEVNGKKLKNDADAWDLYKNADKFDIFELKLKRNNKIKVIDYEIN